MNKMKKKDSKIDFYPGQRTTSIATPLHTTQELSARESWIFSGEFFTHRPIVVLLQVPHLVS